MQHGLHWTPTAIDDHSSGRLALSIEQIGRWRNFVLAVELAMAKTKFKYTMCLWCGRRDSNPHTHRARDFKSRASTNFATSACRHRSRRRAAWSSVELEGGGCRHASKSRDVGQALRTCRPAFGEAWFKLRLNQAALAQETLSRTRISLPGLK